ncbi:hypothetical protein M427DRAFT_39186 [Gonapodya prolifera JEL478]|uniref:Centrosomal protein of 19 kDa n=1 Tax=Gonapodya prolifera (strain JEL478) TaxID=1344416 RepID=A0A138ZXN1_GONPJ|nr:hypothetical protein M427DRAFT_39186 [Gonapodya prolifera JEL478]|eukprot:KXS09258.1 hypothetical protein M427DRAFT_39186 [Gonapodya prolifera JEL478]
MPIRQFADDDKDGNKHIIPTTSPSTHDVARSLTMRHTAYLGQCNQAQLERLIRKVREARQLWAMNGDDKTGGEDPVNEALTGEDDRLASTGPSYSGHQNESGEGISSNAILNAVSNPVPLTKRNVLSDQNNDDLNKLDDAALEAAKGAMQPLFEQNRIAPGDPRYVYDLRKSFAPAASNEWDDSERSSKSSFASEKDRGSVEQKDDMLEEDPSDNSSLTSAHSGTVGKVQAPHSTKAAPTEATAVLTTSTFVLTSPQFSRSGTVESVPEVIVQPPTPPTAESLEEVPVKITSPDLPPLPALEQSVNAKPSHLEEERPLAKDSSSSLPTVISGTADRVANQSSTKPPWSPFPDPSASNDSESSDDPLSSVSKGDGLSKDDEGEDLSKLDGAGGSDVSEAASELASAVGNIIGAISGSFPLLSSRRGSPDNLAKVTVEEESSPDAPPHATQEPVPTVEPKPAPSEPRRQTRDFTEISGISDVSDVSGVVDEPISDVDGSVTSRDRSGSTGQTPNLGALSFKESEETIPVAVLEAAGKGSQILNPLPIPLPLPLPLPLPETAGEGPETKPQSLPSLDSDARVPPVTAPSSQIPEPERSDSDYATSPSDSGRSSESGHHSRAASNLSRLSAVSGITGVSGVSGVSASKLSAVSANTDKLVDDVVEELLRKTGGGTSPTKATTGVEEWTPDTPIAPQLEVESPKPGVMGSAFLLSAVSENDCESDFGVGGTEADDVRGSGERDDMSRGSLQKKESGSLSKDGTPLAALKKVDSGSVDDAYEESIAEEIVFDEVDEDF